MSHQLDMSRQGTSCQFEAIGHSSTTVARLHSRHHLPAYPFPSEEAPPQYSTASVRAEPSETQSEMIAENGWRETGNKTDRFLPSFRKQPPQEPTQ